jgi:hypothetical protein
MSVLPDGAIVVRKWDVESDSDNEHTDEDKVIRTWKMKKPSKKKTAVILKTISHTVTFKCMGTRKEEEYQDTLCFINRLKPVQQVEVKLLPEQSNPFDSKVTAFVNITRTVELVMLYAKY